MGTRLLKNQLGGWLKKSRNNFVKTREKENSGKPKSSKNRKKKKKEKKGWTM